MSITPIQKSVAECMLKLVLHMTSLDHEIMGMIFDDTVIKNEEGTYRTQFIANSY